MVVKPFGRQPVHLVHVAWQSSVCAWVRGGGKAIARAQGMEKHEAGEAISRYLHCPLQVSLIGPTPVASRNVGAVSVVSAPTNAPHDKNLKQLAEGHDPLDDLSCEICGYDGDEDKMIMCDACDGGHHTYCLRPKLKNVPEGDWYCPCCAERLRPGSLKSKNVRGAARKVGAGGGPNSVLHAQGADAPAGIDKLHGRAPFRGIVFDEIPPGPVTHSLGLPGPSAGAVQLRAAGLQRSATSKARLGLANGRSRAGGGKMAVAGHLENGGAAASSRRRSSLAAGWDVIVEISGQRSTSRESACQDDAHAEPMTCILRIQVACGRGVKAAWSFSVKELAAAIRRVVSIQDHPNRQTDHANTFKGKAAMAELHRLAARGRTPCILTTCRIWKASALSFESKVVSALTFETAALSGSAAKKKKGKRQKTAPASTPWAASNALQKQQLSSQVALQLGLRLLEVGIFRQVSVVARASSAMNAKIIHRPQACG